MSSRFVRRTRRGLLCAVAAGAFACAEADGGLSPPGLDGKAPTVFFPTALELSPDAKFLYVANSNFDRSYNSGALLSVPVTAFDSAAAASGKVLAALPAETKVVRIDGFAGMMKRNPAGTALYLTTRDHGTLTRVAITSDGGFVCDDPTVNGCSASAVKLATRGLTDPYALTFGQLVVPRASSGSSAPAAESVVFVTHISPAYGDTTTIAKPTKIAVIPERFAESEAQDPFGNGGYTIGLGTTGASSVLFDAATSRLFVGGCFERTTADTVVFCSSSTTGNAYANPLREVAPQAGASAAVVTHALGAFVGGSDTLSMAFSSDGTHLYLGTQRPNALLDVELPAPGAVGLPTLHSTTPLASTPQQLHVVPRPTGDLVVAAATEANAVLVVDPAAGQVVAQLRTGGLLAPYGLTSHPTSTGDRLYVGLFKGCGVAAIDLPAGQPQDAAVAGVVGACAK